MSHTIYAAKFDQAIIHQHVHLRRESQSHAPAQSIVYKTKEERHVRISCMQGLHNQAEIQNYYV